MISLFSTYQLVILGNTKSFRPPHLNTWQQNSWIRRTKRSYCTSLLISFDVSLKCTVSFSLYHQALFSFIFMVANIIYIYLSYKTLQTYPLALPLTLKNYPLICTERVQFFTRHICLSKKLCEMAVSECNTRQLRTV